MERKLQRLINTYEEIIERWKESKGYCKTEIQELQIQARIDTLEEVIEDLKELKDN